MSADGDENKWICQYCTYKNYPSAAKCTMCRYPKQLSVTEDIYNLKNELTANLDNRSSSLCGIASSGKEESGCWNCDMCSQKNAVTSKECVQCKSVKNNNLTNIQDQLSNLKIAENEVTPEATSVDENKSHTINRKWCCSSCTYENWPKATKCVMCFQPRSSKISPVPSVTSVNSPERDLISNVAAAVRINEDSYNIRSKRSNNARRTEDGKNNSPSNNNSGIHNTNNSAEIERRSRSLKKLHRSADWPWLNACIAVYKGDATPVLKYLSSGGDPTRQLTHNEVVILNRPSVFDVGYTLVHLAIRFKREDILATLLSHLEGSQSGIKRVPSYVAPDLAADIRRHFASVIRQRKANFPCPFVNEHTTFYLPAEIDDLPIMIQDQLYEEILDKDVQRQLENHIPAIINWSHICTRLYALWNRSAGDCLLDSIMQGTWGVFDRENILRRALADALSDSGRMFYPRWREYESIQATMLDFSLEETQWEDDWAALVSLASQPGSSLEQLHVFVLCHILRRPIIIYSVKSVKSFRGEDIGYVKFEGVYLPLLWEPNFCIKTPLTLGYTRGHFSALVPLEPYTATMNAHLMPDSNLSVTYLPLTDYNRRLLPIHFITQAEMGHEEMLLRQWMDVFVTDSGMLIATQKLHKRPLLVAQMVEEWLNYYRRLVQMAKAPFIRPMPHQDYFSDADTDDE